MTKKIFPALQAMTRRGHLDGPVVGVARSDWTLEQFRARARGAPRRPLRWRRRSAGGTARHADGLGRARSDRDAGR
ncbi:MAG: hypothetical protein E6J57_01815 [Deltaproteobacteria bacterium]|nr:MAG: hypothetical protein E6J57_01815 [Deltaproteobacteria bacterium]